MSLIPFVQLEVEVMVSNNLLLIATAFANWSSVEIERSTLEIGRFVVTEKAVRIGCVSEFGQFSPSGSGQMLGMLEVAFSAEN